MTTDNRNGILNSRVNCCVQMSLCVCLFKALPISPYRKRILTIAAILLHKSFYESVSIFRIKSSTYKGLQVHVLVTFVKPSFPNCNLYELGQKLLSVGSQSLLRKQKDIYSLVLATTKYYQHKLFKLTFLTEKARAYLRGEL